MFYGIFHSSCKSATLLPKHGLYQGSFPHDFATSAWLPLKLACVKSARIWSFCGPYFPTFGLKCVDHAVRRHAVLVW